MSNITRLMVPSGNLQGKLFTAPPSITLSVSQLKSLSAPKRGLPEEVNDFRSDNRKNIKSGLEPIRWAEKKGIPTFYGRLWSRKITADGQVLDFGLMGLKCVTTAGANKIVAAMNTTDAATAIAFKYHGLGTGTNAEAAGDTALQTEITTEYEVNSTRPTGTQTVGASNNIYRTVGVNTVDGSVACTEHGIFSASSSGTLLDRTVFSVVNLASTDTYQTTYDFTIVAGS